MIDYKKEYEKLLYEKQQQEQRLKKVLKQSDRQEIHLLKINEELLNKEQQLKEDLILLNNILNSLSGIIFITDLKLVTLSNKRFKDFFDVDSDYEFNNKINDNVFDMFMQINNYLSLDLLHKGETFPELLNRTNQADKLVSILDKTISPKAFTINILEAPFKGELNFLVSLNDITDMKANEQIIRNKAYFDGLTGVYNRNKLNEIMDKELTSSNNNMLCIAMIDIDHFKNFNDIHGHLVGDEVLIMLAQNINRNMRNQDTFARWGGEEFVLIFPQTTSTKANELCNNLRQIVEKLSHKTAGSITASFGVTQYMQNDTIETILKRCDKALYKAKENGRNRVEYIR